MAEKIRLVFLGTSGMIPDEKRNHPAFLLTYKSENILIDCGEGTQIQFRRAKLNPCKITRILITHWHGDHTLGLPGLLKTLSMSDYKKKLFIYGPKGIKLRLNQMFEAFGRITEYPIEIHEVSGKFFETDEFYLEAESMTHGTPCNAYSFVIKEKTRIDKSKLRKHKIKQGKHLRDLKDGKDITYEGKKHKAKDLIFKENKRKVSFVLDTSMNNKIAPFAMDSDVLVCESSFSSELESKAADYMLLTSKQAAEAAKKAKVKKLILTHISQRYGKNPGKILSEAKKVFKNTLIVKDLDVVEV